MPEEPPSSKEENNLLQSNRGLGSRPRLKRALFLKSPIKDPRSEKCSHQKKELPQTTDGRESGPKKNTQTQESVAKLI